MVGDIARRPARPSTKRTRHLAGATAIGIGEAAGAPARLDIRPATGCARRGLAAVARPGRGRRLTLRQPAGAILLGCACNKMSAHQFAVQQAQNPSSRRTQKQLMAMLKSLRQLAF